MPAPPPASPASPVSPRRMLARGLARHCPRCGGGHLFESWFRMKPACPTCGHVFEREEGFFLGAYVVNLAVTEGLLLLVVVVPTIVLAATEPGFDVLPVVVVGVGAAVAGPLLFYPFSRTIWVALELMLRPGDAIEPGDRRRRPPGPPPP